MLLILYINWRWSSIFTGIRRSRRKSCSRPSLPIKLVDAANDRNVLFCGNIYKFFIQQPSQILPSGISRCKVWYYEKMALDLGNYILHWPNFESTNILQTITKRHVPYTELFWFCFIRFAPPAFKDSCWIGSSDFPRSFCFEWFWFPIEILILVIKSIFDMLNGFNWFEILSSKKELTFLSKWSARGIKRCTIFCWFQKVHNSCINKCPKKISPFNFFC